MESLANILEQKQPLFNTVSPLQSLRDALNRMSCENLDYLIVQEGTDFIGILSGQDVVHKLFSRTKPMEALQVKDIMNAAIPVGSVNDSIDFAIQMMDRYNSRYIAVFDRLEFRGIVSENDLLKQTCVASAVLQDASAERESYHWSY